MTNPQSEAVAKIIADADHIGYSINRTRHVDGLSTYTLELEGGGIHEFRSYAEASEYVADERRNRQAFAILEALPSSKGGDAVTEDQIPDIIELGRNGAKLTASEQSAWCGYELGWLDGRRDTTKAAEPKGDVREALRPDQKISIVANAAALMRTRITSEVGRSGDVQTFARLINVEMGALAQFYDLIVPSGLSHPDPKPEGVFFTSEELEHLEKAQCEAASEYERVSRMRLSGEGKRELQSRRMDHLSALTSLGRKVHALSNQQPEREVIGVYEDGSFLYAVDSPSQQPKAEGWRPISEAPKSTIETTPGGTFVKGIYLLGFCPEDGVTPEFCIDVICWEPTEGPRNQGCWYGGDALPKKPSHFMALPAPPQISALER